MKVLSYIEQMAGNHLTELPDWLADRNIKAGIPLQEFYAQPFKPELIIELFEGWNYDKNLEWYSNEKYIIKIGSYSEEAEIHGGDLVITFDGFNWIPFPRTLDDFITDCQRAGVELNWREQENDR